MDPIQIMSKAHEKAVDELGVARKTRENIEQQLEAARAVEMAAGEQALKLEAALKTLEAAQR